MASQPCQLAQFNIAKMRHPRQAPAMASYNEALTEVLPVALAWPGFIWIMDDAIIALTENHFGPDTAANISLWSDIESLRQFMACPPHAAAMGRQDEWFVPIDEPTFVLWWVPTNHRPTFAEACSRLAKLRRDGADPDAFTLEKSFPPP